MYIMLCVFALRDTDSYVLTRPVITRIRTRERQNATHTADAAEGRARTPPQSADIRDASSIIQACLSCIISSDPSIMHASAHHGACLPCIISSDPHIARTCRQTPAPSSQTTQCSHQPPPWPKPAALPPKPAAPHQSHLVGVPKGLGVPRQSQRNPRQSHLVGVPRQW